MSLYSRAFNQMLRHDAFSPLFSRSAAFSPFSLWEPVFQRQPLQTLFQVEEQPRQQQRTQRHNSSNTATETSNTNSSSDNKDSNVSSSTESSNNSRSSSRQLSRRYDDDHYLTHRHRHRHNRHHHHHPLSLFSPWSVLSTPQMPDMTVDFFTSPEAYTIHAAVPGINKNDIKITVEEGVLNIQAERRHERKEKRQDTNQATNTSTTQQTTAAEQKETEKKEDVAPTTTVEASATATATPAAASTSDAAATSEVKQSDVEDDVDQYDYIESSYGRVERSFPLPDDVDVNQLSAKYEDGVIKINIPRVEQKKQEVKQINIQ